MYDDHAFHTVGTPHTRTVRHQQINKQNMHQNFWNGFYKTLNCEYKEVSEIKGLSGIVHQVNSMGINHDEKRIIISQNEQDARILAMAQTDIAGRLKDYNVLMVRPVPINLSKTFTHISLLLGSNIMSLKDLSEGNKDGSDDDIVNKNKEQIESIFKGISPQIEIIQKTSLNLVPIFKELVHQLSHLKFIQDLEDKDQFEVDFGQILGFNPLVFDNAAGVCPLPFYNFTLDEAESFLKPKNIEENIQILKKHNIYQFFYPPADSLALGLIESKPDKESNIIKTVSEVPLIGHPFGENEIIDANKIDDIVEALKDKGLAVEGEIGMTITKEGVERRAIVKFSPRESIFKRISNMISIKVDFNLKDLKDILRN